MNFALFAMTAIAITSTASFAHAAADEGSRAKDLPECTTIAAQCDASGFKPGKHKQNKMGLWMDCVGKVAKGETVAGISVSAADAKICADAAKAMRKSKKAEHGH